MAAQVVAESVRAAWAAPRAMRGRVVSLEPLDLDRDVDALFALVANDQAMFRHYPLPFPSVFTNAAQLRAVYADPMAKGGFHAYVLRRVGDGATVGSCALMDLAPLHRTAELGRIWIAPQFRGGALTAEMVFLALRHAFEEMQCARVLWKCDDLNEPSKRLARKCGAVFEGVLRKHYLMPSGRHRDSAYFSWIDTEWATCKLRLEALVAQLAERDGPQPRPRL